MLLGLTAQECKDHVPLMSNRINPPVCVRASERQVQQIVDNQIRNAGHLDRREGQEDIAVEPVLVGMVELSSQVVDALSKAPRRVPFLQNSIQGRLVRVE